MMVWLDLETSALEPDEGVILEIAAIAVNDDLREKSRFHAVLECPAEMPDDVLMMHGSSGLYDLCRRSVLAEPEAEAEFCVWLDSLNGGELLMAGSGVSHFDMHWLRARMPYTASRFHYATVDVGVLRRSLRIIGIEMPEMPESSGPKKAHRAMADVEAHLTEFRLMKQSLSRLMDEVLT